MGVITGNRVGREERTASSARRIDEGMLPDGHAVVLILGSTTYICSHCRYAVVIGEYTHKTSPAGTDLLAFKDEAGEHDERICGKHFTMYDDRRDQAKRAPLPQWFDRLGSVIYDED